MQNEYEIKNRFGDNRRRIYNRNMVAANDGNISVKLNERVPLHTYWCIQSFMTPEFICK